MKINSVTNTINCNTEYKQLNTRKPVCRTEGAQCTPQKGKDH